MSDPIKKRKNLSMFIKRQVSTTVAPDELSLDQLAVAANSTPKNPPPVVLRAKSSTFNNNGPTQKRGSLGAIEDLVQCPLCFEKLCIPKMLPCQHTFCLHCLHTQVKDNVLTCPLCTTKFPVTSGFLTSLPSNLYIDSLLKLLINPSGTTERPVTFAATTQQLVTPQKRCSQCQSMVEMFSEHCCNHCKQIFCGVCWSAHIAELKSQISSLNRQLEVGSKRLNHRFDDYKDRYEWLVNQINTTVETKISDLKIQKQNLIEEAATILSNGETSSTVLQKQLKEVQENVTKCLSTNFDTISDDNEKVTTFMNFHRLTVELLNEVAHWGETKFSFDQDSFRIEEDLEIPADAEADEPVTVEVKGIQNPLESPDTLALYYRSRNFTPRIVLRKCPRPAGVGVAPWAGQDNLYVCSTDSHNVMIIDRIKGKIVQKLSDPNMLCPQSITFSQIRGEIYVTDKWKHCIHVFSKDGNYVKAIGAKGNKDGFFRSPEGIAIDSSENLLYVCDTGNDRVQVFNINTGAFVAHIGIINRQKNSSSVNYTQLNAPTGIAVTSDRIIIVDSGNTKGRIKIYSINGEESQEFGAVGSHKGQFRHPEVVAVDPLGFILVGDSGNARIQIFKPNGQLVRVFGGSGQEAGKFGWISGVHITPSLEIIVSDTRNHQVNIF